MNNDDLSPEFLKTILKNSTQAIITCDLNSKITYMNNQARDLHGVPRDAEIAHCEDFFQFFEVDGITPTSSEKNPLRRVLNGQEVKNVYHYILKKDRAYILIKYTGSYLKDDSGNVTGAMISADESQSEAQSLSRFIAIFEQSPLSVQIVSPDGRTLLVNKAFQNLWGLSDDFIKHFILKEYNILEDPILENSGRLDDLKRAFRGETVYIKEFYYDPSSIGLPGRPRWADGTIYPLKNVFREVTEVVVIHQDRTDQRNSEQEKENLLSQLKGIVSQLPVGILLQNSSGEIDLYNEQMSKLIGSPVVAKEIFNAPIEKALTGEMINSLEVNYVGATGLLKTFLTNSGPIYNVEKRITSSILIASDITAEKRRERHKAFLIQVKSLLISTIDYESMLDRIAGATIPYMADGCMVDILDGDKIKRIISKHHNPKIQGHLNELVQNYTPTLDSPQPASKVMRSGLPDLMKTVDNEIIKKHTIDRKHAALIDMIGIRSHIAVPLKIRGKTIGCICIYLTEGRPNYDEQDFLVAQELARDASVAIDNAKLYQEAQNAIRLRDDFISMASHELKTPITSLNLKVEVLNDLVEGLKLDSEVPKLMTKFLGSTNKQLQRLSRLVDDMLDISRITTGKLSLTMRHINFCTIVNEVHERFKDQLKELQIETQLYTSQEAMVMCDPERMDQVITNFMTNAIRYGGRKPIHLIVEQDHTRVIFKIKDHGRGIKREDQVRIFNRFERVQHNSDVDGLGLGLYINKQIIDEHKGKMYLESEEGEGAIFAIELSKMTL